MISLIGRTACIVYTVILAGWDPTILKDTPPKKKIKRLVFRKDFDFSMLGVNSTTAVEVV